MKQGLLLMAVYALIINQARKDNNQEIPEEVFKKMQVAVPASSFSDHLQVNKYAYLGQSVFLLNAAGNRSFIMLEDGTCYEVIDHHNEETRPDYYTNAVYKDKDLAQQ